jgi:hypothetical protein
MTIKMAEDLIAFCYYFLIEQNYHNLDLNSFDDISMINFDRIDEYSRKYQHTRKFTQLIKELYSKYRYISKKEIIDIIDKNIKELYELLSTNSKYIPIIIITNESFKKSNIFFTAYFLKRFYEMYRIKIPYAFSTVSDIFKNMINKSQDAISFGTFKNITLKDEYELEFKDKTLIIILCDDFSYSGSQLSGHLVKGSGKPLPKIIKPTIMNQNNNYNGKMQFDTNVKFFFNIIGLTNKAETLIRNEFDYPDLHIILPKSIIKNSIILNDILKGFTPEHIYDNDIFILHNSYDYITIQSQFYQICADVDLALVLPFHKYPDYVSTVQFLCKFKTLKDQIIIDQNKLNDIYPSFKSTIINHKKFYIDTFFNPEMCDKLKTAISTGIIPEDINWLYKYEPEIDTQFIKLIDSCEIDNTNYSLDCNDLCESASFYKKIKYTLDGKLLSDDDKIYENIYSIFTKYILTNKITQNGYTYDEYMTRSKNRQYGGKDKYYENKQMYLKINKI